MTTDKELIAAFAAGQDLVAASVGAILRRDIRTFIDPSDERAFGDQKCFAMASRSAGAKYGCRLATGDEFPSLILSMTRPI
jgi:hypothetical protein